MLAYVGIFRAGEEVVRDNRNTAACCGEVVADGVDEEPVAGFKMIKIRLVD